MTDEKPKDSNREMAIRTQALDMALRSNCGQCYDTEGKLIYDAEEITKAAKIFEGFIRGENTPSYINPLTPQLNEPKFEPIKKDEWK